MKNRSGRKKMRRVQTETAKVFARAKEAEWRNPEAEEYPPPQAEKGASANRYFKDSGDEPEYKKKAKKDRCRQRKREFEQQKARREQAEAQRKKGEEGEWESKEAEKKESRERRRAAYWAEAKYARVSDAIAHGRAYHLWSGNCDKFFTDHSTAFPDLTRSSCPRADCLRGDKLKVCHHDVERTLKGSGCYSERWLRKESWKWHPDKFSTRPEVQEMAKELFQMIQRLLDQY